MTRTALITGASRGLGLALARSLVSDGWTLVIDGRDGHDLRDAAADLGDASTLAIAGDGPVLAVPGDVADESHRRALVDAVDRASPDGHLDLLVHNASVLGPSPQPPL